MGAVLHRHKIFENPLRMGAGNFVSQAFNRAVVGHLHQRIAKQPRRIIGAVQPELNRFAVQMVSQSQ